MRYACVAVLLASVFGVSPIAALDEDQVVGGSPARDAVPEEFRFLFWSSEQWARETVGAQRAASAAALWKGLPYDSISLERGVTGGCLGVCRSSKVTLYRRTTENATTLPDLAGRAELRTVGLDESRQARTSDLTGSVNLLTYGNLSYLEAYRVRRRASYVSQATSACSS